MGSALRRWHCPSRRAGFGLPGVVDFRSTVVSKGFSALAVVIRTCCPVLRGRARARDGSLFDFFCWYVERSGAGAGPIAQLARARA